MILLKEYFSSLKNKVAYIPSEEHLIWITHVFSRLTRVHYRSFIFVAVHLYSLPGFQHIDFETANSQWLLLHWASQNLFWKLVSVKTYEYCRILGYCLDRYLTTIIAIRNRKKRLIVSYDCYVAIPEQLQYVHKFISSYNRLWPLWWKGLSVMSAI